MLHNPAIISARPSRSKMPPLPMFARRVRCSVLKDETLLELTLGNGIKVYTLTGPSVSNFFSICFRTPAISRSGEQHILEHMIVSGSKKFPNPNVYANMHCTSEVSPGACTWYNKTWYYGTAKSLDGLKHLAEYLTDSTLHPRLTEESFHAESFHYVKDQNQRGKNSLFQSGVVYNEMRQCYLHPSYVSIRNAIELLMPGAVNMMDFGGNPAEIPPVKYKDILRYHGRFYFPQNATFFISSPGDIDPIISMLEKLPVSKREFDHKEHVFRPVSNYKHLDLPVEYPVGSANSSLVILIPFRPPRSLEEIVFFDLLHNTLFYFDRNHYTKIFRALKLKGRCCVNFANRVISGNQTVVAIQVDSMHPDDFHPMSEALIGSYHSTNPRRIPFSAFSTALSVSRHLYEPTDGDKSFHILWQLTEESEGQPHLNRLRLPEMVKKMLGDPKKAYEHYLSFVAELFNKEPLIFTQTPIYTPEADVAANSKGISKRIKSLSPALPVAVDESPIRLAKVKPKYFDIDIPFKSDGIEQIIKTPVSDDRRIHLNVGFDFAGMPRYLWTHAITLIKTFCENQASFQNPHHSFHKFYTLSSEASSMSYPVDSDGCYLFINFALFPKELAQFLRHLSAVMKSPDLEKNSYINGLYYQRDALYSDIFDPSASRSLEDAFTTRLLAYNDQGYRQREVASGFYSLANLNQLIAKYEAGSFGHSLRRLKTAANYLFGSDGLILQYSAPENYDQECSTQLRSFLDHLGPGLSCDHIKVHPNIPRNEILIAKTRTNVAARSIKLREFESAFEVPMTYLRGYVIRNELGHKRGFYRDFSHIDHLNKLAVLMVQRGSSATAPFQVFDHLPEYLRRSQLSAREFKALKIGALKAFDNSFSSLDNASSMLARLRAYRLGMDAAHFDQAVSDIMSATPGIFKTFADVLDEQRLKARNLILTNDSGAQDLKRGLKSLKFGKPTKINLI